MLSREKIIKLLSNENIGQFDYYFNDKGKEEIAPKFISLSMSEEINERTYDGLVSIIKKNV